MARSKKKTAVLSPEDKLQQALVPMEEQPYKVPENWRWVEFDSIVSVSKDKTNDFSDNNINYIGLEHLEKDKGIIGFGNAVGIKSQKSIFHRGQILYGKLRPYLNKHDIAPLDGVCSTDILVLDTKPQVSAKLLNYYLNQSIFIDYAIMNSKGINLPRVSEAMVLKAPFPLPPLPEQQRIVDRIESLFAKLDEAKEKAQAVVDGFEDRKAAILHKAFTGELTAKWRNTHGVAIDDWETAPLETVFQLRSGSTIDASEEQKYGAIPYVKVADMNLPENEIQITTSSRFVDDCPESHVIPKGSTIFPKRGGAILTNKKRYVGVEKIIADLNTMAIMPIVGRAYGWYGYYWMQSVDLRQLNNGSNVPQINNKDMVKLFVPTPSIDEQKAIVWILDSVFDKEIEAKEAAETVIDQIDVMKKSILARAFRGELGTNDPNDESAVELLKSVL